MFMHRGRAWQHMVFSEMLIKFSQQKSQNSLLEISTSYKPLDYINYSIKVSRRKNLMERYTQTFY